MVEGKAYEMTNQTAGGIKMGQSRQFRAGDKAPNNGVYIEIGETGSMVNDPKQVRLEAGESFPETANQNRIWTYKPKPGPK